MSTHDNLKLDGKGRPFNVKPKLTLSKLRAEASEFAASSDGLQHVDLFGVTDGKRIGTFVEHAFRDELIGRYRFEVGSSGSGIDFPELNVDMKVTSQRHPQSSCPYRSAEQKVYGLGYHLLIFVYERADDESARLGRLRFLHVLFVDSSATADFQTTRGIREILERDGNTDDLFGFIQERNLPVDDIGASRLVKRILREPPALGLLTISNALQWRLQFRRVIEMADDAEGVVKLK